MQQAKKIIKDKDHIVQVKTSALPVVFTLSQNKLLEKRPQIKQHQQEIKSEQITESPQNVKTNQNRISLLFQNTPSTPNSENEDKYNSFYLQSNTGTAKSKPADDKVSFFELARFLKAQETDFNFYVNKQFPLMKQIRIFGPGEAFGEIALLTKSRRTGTMVCKEDCHVMTLKKDGFDKIMGYYNNVIITERIKFFKEFEFMKQIPESKLMVLLHETKIQYFTRNQTIYTENDPLLYMYFVKEGEITISEKILINPPKFQQQLSKNKQNNLHSKNEFYSSDQDIFDKFCLKAFLEQNKQKRMIVYSQSNSSFFGELELIDKSINSRYQQAICTSQDCILYTVRKEILLQFLRRFSGIQSLIEESNRKRAHQMQLIEEFQNKKCEKIIRNNQIKYERLKRKQFIKDQLTVKNRRQSCIESLPNSPKLPINKSMNNSTFINKSNISSSQRLSIDYKLTKDDRIQENHNSSKHLTLQKEQQEILKSCVGQKSIDDAIKKAFQTPGIDWVNPCYRSLDHSKYSNNSLNKKLEDLSERELQKTPERNSFLVMWDYIQQQKDSQNYQFQSHAQGSTKKRQSQSILSPNVLQPQMKQSRSDYFYQKQSSASPTSNNHSKQCNQSMTNFQDYILFNSTQTNYSKASNSLDYSQQNQKELSTSNNNFRESFEQSSSSSHKIKLELRREKKKNRNYYFNSNTASTTTNSNQNQQQHSLSKEEQLFYSPNNQIISPYHSKLQQIVLKSPNSKEQNSNLQLTKTFSTSGFQQTNYNPHKTQSSFKTTIRKFNPTQNSFYKTSDSQKTLFSKLDMNNNEQLTMNLFQDAMFKTSKQLKQELQTQTQIKNTILQQFMRDSCDSQTQNNNQLDLLYNDPQESKSLQKAMFAKLLHLQKRPSASQKPKQFNSIHIDIIQKLNIHS